MSLHGAERSYIEVLTQRGVSECDRKASIMRRPGPLEAVVQLKNNDSVSHQVHLSIKDVENRVLWYETARGLLDKYQFLNASAKLRKATISCMSCLSVRPFPTNNSAPTVTIFMKFLI
jgi:hypothetical protein